MDLKNSTILITGGSSGIGLELVKQLSAQGATILITGRKPEALHAAKAKYPHIHCFQSDVSNPDDIEDLYQDVTEQFPDLNMIINNAGLMRLIDVQDTRLGLADINREIVTNLTGTIQMVHRFLPHLLKKKSAAIVNVSSVIAYLFHSTAPVYSASKAGVRAYTQALRLQLEDTNVKVFELVPSGIKTNLQNDWVLQPNPAMMMDVDKMVRVAIKGFIADTPEIKPFLVSVVKTASRIIPRILVKFGHGEFKKFKQLNLPS
jgi:uncharacterized oxidoreductase